jgi:hypothetical protein
MRFLTLTTAGGVTRDINKSWAVLKIRIWRTFGWKINRYFKLKTKEGNGVLHIVYRGKFIPQSWLSRNWFEIHFSRIVDIRELHYRAGARRIANYLIVNYLQAQKTIRMSYGWKWVWLGFCKSWEHVKQTHGFLRRAGIGQFGKMAWTSFAIRTHNVALQIWHWRLKEPLAVTRQLNLQNFLCYG